MAHGGAQRQLIRVKQIRALYRRELTALNRDPGIDDATRLTRAESLWRQATAQLERLRTSLDLDALPEDERALFEPLARPAYLDPPD
jgi:hypothetical protein